MKTVVSQGTLSGSQASSGTDPTEYVLAHSGGWRLANGEITLNALRRYRDRVLGCEKTFCLSIGRGGHFKVYFTRRDLERSQKRGRSILRDPRGLIAFRRGVRRAIWELQAEIVRILDAGPPNRPSAWMADAFERSTARLVAVYAHYQLSGSEFCDGVHDEIANTVRTRVFSEADVLACLTGADLRRVASTEAEQEWANIAYRATQEDETVPQRLMEDLEDYVRRFGHLGIRGARATGWTVADLQTRLQRMDGVAARALREEVIHRRRQSAGVGRRARLCAERIGLDPGDLGACRALADLAAMRLRIREAVQGMQRVREIIFDRVAEILEARSTEYVGGGLHRQLTGTEILSVLRGSAPPSLLVLEERSHCSVMWLQRDRIVRARGAEGEALLTRLDLANGPRASGEGMRGTVVFGEGTVVGRAYIPQGERIHPGAQVDGKILVSHSLRPDLIPLCRFAAGIVTQEGGVTSHASVIARELGIPCIVGVADVLERVAPGDRLQLDLDSGTVGAATDGASPAAPSRPRGRELRTERDPQADPPPQGPPLVEIGGPHAHDSALVGGKAAMLGYVSDLTPPGFVITTPALAEQPLSRVGRTALKERLKPLLERWKVQSVVVRSSSTLEGGEGHSFAGLFRTVSGVVPRPAQVLSAADSVVRSSSGEGVTEYLRAHGITNRPAMAVLVQAEVRPRVSGIVRTGVPRHGREWLLLEYVAGGLAAMADGRATPSRTACEMPEAADMRLSASRLVPPGLEALTGEAGATRLLGCFEEVMAKLGSRLELEWGIDQSGRPWIFQVRALTRMGRLA